MGQELEDPFVWDVVRVAGQDIHYRVAGPVDGPVMVHVHGFAISGSYLVPTARLLTDTYRVYIPDLPGFGRSPRPDHALDLFELGQALDGFMIALGIERAVLVGNSLGCAISAELISADPARVDRAIMVGLAGGAHNRPLLRAVGQMARDGLEEPPRLILVAAPDYLRFGPLRALRLFRLMTKYPSYEKFVAIGVPTMVVIGSEDPLRPSWRRIRRALVDLPPQVTLVLFQGAAHAINFTHPRELAHTIRLYLNDEPIRMAADNPDGLPVLQLLRPV